MIYNHREKYPRKQVDWREYMQQQNEAILNKGKKKQVHYKTEDDQDNKQDDQQVTVDTINVEVHDLKSCLARWEQLDRDNKTAILQDETGNLVQFLKYKGQVVEIAKFLVLKAMNRQSMNDFQEDMRFKLYSGLRTGYQVAWNFDKNITPSLNLYQLMEGTKFNSDKLFTPNQLKDKQFYKKCILTEEEDKDNYGNKGLFVHEEKFNLGLLFHGENEEYKEFINHNQLNPEQFEVIIVR